jgi:hypothetical protein
MRSLLVIGFVGPLLCAAALAQTAPPASTPPASTPPATAVVPHGRHANGMTRQEFIDRASHRAAERFDQLDTNHDGILTREERRAGRANRKKGDSE